MMNFGKKFAVGVASAALVASLGGLVAPSAVADSNDRLTQPNFIGGLDRLAGADRVATSLKVAAHQWGSNRGDYNPKRVYLASAEDKHMVDAATAGMLLDGPIVYVSNNVYVGTAVGNFLADTVTNPGFKNLETVVPIGGEAAIAKSVSQAVADVLKEKVTKKAKVGDALAGKDRYGTSVAIAQYLYEQSMNRHADPAWYGMTNQHDGKLNVAYFANGADNHVVDSMVAGTLDDGPILLVEPDGKIPEVVAEFIKKTLPMKFGALGGTASVPDSTVNEAWVIKALANKWDSSYEIPGANKSVRELERLVYGNGTSKDLSSDYFKGLKKAMDEDSKPVRDAWGYLVSGLKLETDKAFSDAKGKLKLTDDDYADIVLPNLKAIYGTKVLADPDNKYWFLKKNDNESTYKGVDWEKLDASGAYAKDTLKPAKDILESLWKGEKQTTVDNTVLSKLARLSQVGPDSTEVNATKASEQTTLSTADGVPLKAVYDLAVFTVETQEKWFEAAKKQLAAAQGVLRGQLDKTDEKTVLRLGGKDRFETSQLIANQWAKECGAEYDRYNTTGGIGPDYRFFEVYVANGTRLPDALTAGQLKKGPILLVRGNEKTIKDLPEFTAKVARYLQCWTDKKHTLKLYGIGGKAILADSSLQAVVDLANTGSVCAPEKDRSRIEDVKTTGLKASPVSFQTGDKATAPGDKNVSKLSFWVDGKDSKTLPTATMVKIYKLDANDKKIGDDLVQVDAAKETTKLFTVEGLKYDLALKGGQHVYADADNDGKPDENAAATPGKVTIKPVTTTGLSKAEIGKYVVEITDEAGRTTTTTLNVTAQPITFELKQNQTDTSSKTVQANQDIFSDDFEFARKGSDPAAGDTIKATTQALLDEELEITKVMFSKTSSGTNPVDVTDTAKAKLVVAGTVSDNKARVQFPQHKDNVDDSKLGWYFVTVHDKNATDTAKSEVVLKIELKK